jgi:TusA-related sulfurtransferase
MADSWRLTNEVTMSKSNQSDIMEAGAIEPAARLELLSAGDTMGAACATLTPAIRAELQELQSGQVLLVSVDDPSARLDVPAWCALTGNVLQATTIGYHGVLHFFIRKK